jgi:hypothetical protein
MKDYVRAITPPPLESLNAQVIARASGHSWSQLIDVGIN